MRIASLLLLSFFTFALASVTLPDAVAKKADYEVVEVKSGGTVRGVCRLSKAVEIPKLFVRDHKLRGGKEYLPSPRIEFHSKTLGLANCLVGLRGVTKGKNWPESMRAKDRSRRIDFVPSGYDPHLSIVRPGTQINFSSKVDGVANSHAFHDLGTVFNFFLQPGAHVDDLGDAFLKRPGHYRLADDCCPRVSGHIFVLRHPYFAPPTEIDGKYYIDDVPPGTYELVCWHEGMKAEPIEQEGSIVGYDFGEPIAISKPVTVKAGETVFVNFVAPAPE